VPAGGVSRHIDCANKAKRRGVCERKSRGIKYKNVLDARGRRYTRAGGEKRGARKRNHRDSYLKQKRSTPRINNIKILTWKIPKNRTRHENGIGSITKTGGRDWREEDEGNRSESPGKATRKTTEGAIKDTVVGKLKRGGPGGEGRGEKPSSGCRHRRTRTLVSTLRIPKGRGNTPKGGKIRHWEGSEHDARKIGSLY